MEDIIDFSKYSKIEIEPKSRWIIITKHKSSILAVFLTIIIIILIIVIIDNNNILGIKNKELSLLDKTLNEINSNISTIEQKITSFENNKSSLLNDLNYINSEISSIQSEYDTLEKNNMKLLYNKYDLIAHKEYIKNKISYKEKILKEDELTSELISKQNIYYKKLQRFNDLSLTNSNIITNLDIFETLTNSKILKRCYDSEIYGLTNVYRFHENCDGYPLLILIKTKKGENIGAYTSMTNEGIKNIKDENSLIINFNQNKYYLYNKDNNNNCEVYSHYDEFPKFGNDLIIHNNGIGEYIDNKCYSYFGDINAKFLNETNFEINFLEIYRVKA